MSAPAEQVDPLTGEILDEDAPDTGGWDRDRHCAADLRGVDWAGAKLRAAQEQVAINDVLGYGEVQALKMRIAQAEKRLERANAPFEKTVAFMENAIRTFAQANRAEVLKGLPKDRKSRLLPSGVTVAYRTPREQIEVTDAQAIWDWSAPTGFGDEIFPPLSAPTAADRLSKKGLNRVLSTVEYEVPGVRRTPGVEEVQVWTDLSKSKEEGK